MLAPQSELVTILPGGGLVQTSLPTGVRVNNPGVPVVSSCLMVHGRTRPIRAMPIAVPGSPPQSVTTVSPHRRPVAGRCRTTWPTGATAPLPGQRAPAPHGSHRRDRRSRRAPRAPAARLGAPQTHAATGDPVERAVGRPGETDEPARRKPRTALAVVGHALISLATSGSRRLVRSPAGGWELPLARAFVPGPPPRNTPA